MSTRRHWDAETRQILQRRTCLAAEMPGAGMFFTAEEAACARDLLDCLMGRSADETPPVNLARLVDRRLAANETDGWHVDSMPIDREAWRRSVRGLQDDARTRFHRPFTDCSRAQQERLLESVRTFSGRRWHGLPPQGLWGLWTRYAATACYGLPSVWDEIGFPGPAYPRGYKNLGVDRREPFEVRDAGPHRAAAGADG